MRATAKPANAIATVTFYGQDQAGNEIIASGNIGVNFGDWGDPAN